ncbi:MAG: DnaD domain protein [Oscillospiraceae bacterium]|jgi:DnaD/phage-associated family protein|nr:DnaD domain protein [Oscillospiraceae bacterium]
MSEVIVSVETVRKLLAAGNGDSALLYLCRAAELSDVATGFTEARLECAASLLRQLGLDERRAPRFQQSAQRPEYTEQDIRRQMEVPGSDFKRFVGEVQRCMGRALSNEELKILLSMREYLGLSVEVLNVLIHYCVDRSRSRGAGRMPSMRIIEKEAYRWADLEIDTLEKAAAHIQSEAVRYSRLGELCRMLGITGRRLTPAEERYLQAWVDMGFSNDAVSLAYEKTCENTGGLTWKYMNSILERWNQQRLYTADQVRALDKKPVARKGGYQRHGEAPSPAMLDAARQMLEED